MIERVKVEVRQPLRRKRTDRQAAPGKAAVVNQGIKEPYHGRVGEKALHLFQKPGMRDTGKIFAYIGLDNIGACPCGARRAQEMSEPVTCGMRSHADAVCVRVCNKTALKHRGRMEHNRLIRDTIRKIRRLYASKFRLCDNELAERARTPRQG